MTGRAVRGGARTGTGGGGAGCPGRGARRHVLEHPLVQDLARVAAGQHAGIGVYVRDLDSGVAASFQSSESWYLASTLKVPVAIAVLRGVERGRYTLDTTVVLQASDYVDGAGLTNRRAVGTALPIRYLVE